MVNVRLLAVVALTGCSLITDSFQTNEFSGDPFPIGVDTSTGAVIVGLRQEGKDDRTAIIDVMTPITVVDPGPTVPIFIDYADVIVMGNDGTGSLTRPRARLPSAQLVALHPCNTDECLIGSETAPQLAYQAIIGADALAGDTLRLRLVDEAVFILPDVAGDGRRRSIACDTVFPSPYRGGGTLTPGGTELAFSGRRVVLQSCLAPNPNEALPQSKRGSNALLVASTSVGATILAKSAYERYRMTYDNVPPEFGALPDASVTVPSGLLAGKRALIPSIAFVATSPSFPRAPCRQVYAHHLLVARNCQAGDDCPCEDGNTLCGVPAVIEVKPADQLEVIVIADDVPCDPGSPECMIQDLRTELRPDQQEVDGILGTQAMRELELDIDYPNNRLLARCTGLAENCQTRPELYDGVADRERILGCFADIPGPSLP